MADHILVVVLVVVEDISWMSVVCLGITVVVVVGFFFVRITVVGTTIIVMTNKLTPILRRIPYFFLRCIDSLKTSVNSSRNSVSLIYLIAEDTSEVSPALLAIELQMC